MIARQQLRRATRILIPLRITPPFLLAVRGISTIILWDCFDNEAFSLLVRQNSPFAAHAFSHQNPHHTRWPDHPGGMELNEFHVDQVSTCVISEGVTVASVLPTVAGDFVRAPNST